MHSSKTLESLATQSLHNEELLIAVRSRLPDPLCDHCLAALLSNDKLSLFVDSPAWSARARFLKEPLQRDLRPLGISFAQLVIKVFRPSLPRALPKGHRPLLSSKTANLLRISASGISDPRLREALLRLASHTGG